MNLYDRLFFSLERKIQRTPIGFKGWASAHIWGNSGLWVWATKMHLKHEFKDACCSLASTSVLLIDSRANHLFQEALIHRTVVFKRKPTSVGQGVAVSLCPWVGILLVSLSFPRHPPRSWLCPCAAVCMDSLLSQAFWGHFLCPLSAPETAWKTLCIL